MQRWMFLLFLSLVLSEPAFAEQTAEQKGLEIALEANRRDGHPKALVLKAPLDDQDVGQVPKGEAADGDEFLDNLCQLEFRILTPFVY